MNAEFALQSLPEGYRDILIALSIGVLLVWMLYALTVRKMLKLIAPENRFLEPNMAWLLAIPLFNIYWNFVVAKRAADSLTNEFYDRKIAEEESPGRYAGLRYALFFLLSNIPFPAFIGLTFLILTIIYFVSYWVKVYNFKLLLEEHNDFRKNQTNTISDDSF